MPILHVKISAPRSREMTRRGSAVLSDLTKTILGKDPRVTSIAIEYVDPEEVVPRGRVAERVRFELTVPVKARQFSRLEQ